MRNEMVGHLRMVSSLSSLIAIILCLFLTAGCSESRLRKPSSDIPKKEERIAQIKKSTVRIYVNGKPRGTGFVIDKNGLIATSFHVVGKTQMTARKRIFITYSSPIEVQFADGDKAPAIPHKSCIGQGLYEAVLKDYCILEVKTSKELVPLRLGNFNDVYEGAAIYKCGYSFSNEQPAVSFGSVSTKWQYIVESSQSSPYEKRKSAGVAWLDIPMSNGDCGGPITLVGNEPEDDRVIGIASFIPTPLDHDLKAIIKAFKNYETDKFHSSICTIELFNLMKKTRGVDSLFINGCISIDFLRLRLQKLAKKS